MLTRQAMGACSGPGGDHGTPCVDLCQSQAIADLLGSRDTLKESFVLGLISDGESWMLMIQDRNLTSHTYNCSSADSIAAHFSVIDLPQGVDRCPGRCQWCW